ncbi:MAG: ABC transporter substrate-binding protein, partial [Oscillospiraceae bacterium]|nr:ABC transporter substrate-binding protein [Oscillospiraceae bacterium]
MKHFKKLLPLLLALCMLLTLTACGQKAPESAAPPADSGTDAAPAAAPAAAEPKFLKMAVNFAYPSLDAHKDYYGWYTQIYGVTETLFRIDSEMSVQPLLAKDSSVSEDGKTWTIEL